MTGARLALALLLAWACGLRLWLAVPELDEGRFWDERYGVENLCSLLVDGQLRPAPDRLLSLPVAVGARRHVVALPHLPDRAAPAFARSRLHRRPAARGGATPTPAPRE